MMQITLSILFILAFVFIAIEDIIKMNKASIALFFAIVSWVILLFTNNHDEHVSIILAEHLGSISGILFFLLGAMTIVEIIDAHDGFYEISKMFSTTSKFSFLLYVAILSFFISSILDNLTASIVMVSIINKLIKEHEQKWYLSGLIIIAANAGGAWSPIGDITTTMLWMGGQIETLAIIKSAFIPSFMSLIIAIFLIHFKMKGDLVLLDRTIEIGPSQILKKERVMVLILGILLFIMIPLLKASIQLPPFAGMLFALSIIWIVTSLLHQHKPSQYKDAFSVQSALQRIDTSSILFFLGILLNISALEFAGILDSIAVQLSHYTNHPFLMTSFIGLISSLVDNVPLVAASQKLFTLSQYPKNHIFWVLLAYAAGTGGSCLIIGSAAGVGVMGMQKISFLWYLKHITWIALISFMAGFLVFMIQGIVF